MKSNGLIAFVLGFLSVAAVPSQAWAQKDVLRPCPGTSGAECVEFTVRYHLNEQKSGPAGPYSGSKKIELLTGDPSKPASLKAASPGCEVEKNSCQVTKDKVNVLDLSGLRFL